MFQRKPGRFRHRSNDRGFRRPNNDDGKTRVRTNSFSNGDRRNNFRPAQSAEKLFQKYNDLAKEALASGDKTASENYFQHADHFSRIIEDKKKYRSQNKIQVDSEATDAVSNLIDGNKSQEISSIEEKK
jgi:hypothetical protein